MNVVSIAAGGHRAAVIARRDALVEAHLGLAKSIARGISCSLPASFELDDLVQVGCLGLLKAATNYRPDAHNGTPFDAYARPVIRGAILDSVRRGKYVENTRPSCEQLPHPSITPAYVEALDRERKADEVRAAIGELPARMRAVLNWHYRDEMAFPEVGRRLEVCRSRASQIHCEAVRLLRSNARMGAAAV